MTRERFGEIVEEVIAELPDSINEHLRDVLFVVEDEPSEEDRDMLGFDRRDTVFGMFEGTPLSERSFADNSASPDRIVLFYRPLVREFRTPWAIRREIRVTLIHEVAHFLGMEEEEVAAEGYE